MLRNRNDALAEVKVQNARRRREMSRKAERIEQEWRHDHLIRDLHRSSRQMTDEIVADPSQADALTRAREQAREGKLISQEDLDCELQNDDE